MILILNHFARNNQNGDLSKEVKNMFPGDNGKTITVREIENGYEVTVVETKKKLSRDGNNFLFDERREIYAFDTAEEASEMVLDLLEEEEDLCEDC